MTLTAPEVAAMNAANAQLKAARAQEKAAKAEEETARQIAAMTTTITGPQGIQGPVGPEGPQGLAIKGEPGTNGTNGKNGDPGKTGPRGLQGPVGNGVGPDEKVKLSKKDPAAGFLTDKLKAGLNVQFRREKSPDGDSLVIDATGGGGGGSVGASTPQGINVYDDGVAVGFGDALSFDGGDPVTASGGIIHVPLGPGGSGAVASVNGQTGVVVTPLDTVLTAGNDGGALGIVNPGVIAGLAVGGNTAGSLQVTDGDDTLDRGGDASLTGGTTTTGRLGASIIAQGGRDDDGGQPGGIVARGGDSIEDGEAGGSVVFEGGAATVGDADGGGVTLGGGTGSGTGERGYAVLRGGQIDLQSESDPIKISSAGVGGDVGDMLIRTATVVGGAEWGLMTTVQTGPPDTVFPSTFITPFVFDDTPSTGGLYAWVGAVYVGVGSASFTPATDPGDIADPTIATPESNALKINALFANMRTAGMLA